jgi:hypothetical protein
MSRTAEGAVLRGAVALLKLRGFPAFRMNSGAMVTPAGGLIRFGAVGMSDLVVLVPGTGRMMALELKAGRNKPTKDQLAFLETVRTAGGVAVWLSDLAKLDAILVALRRDPAADFSVEGDPLGDDTTPRPEEAQRCR